MEDLTLEKAIEEQTHAERSAVTEVSRNKYGQMRYWLEELKERRDQDGVGA
jgi:predicted ATPase